MTQVQRQHRRWRIEEGPGLAEVAGPPPGGARERSEQEAMTQPQRQGHAWWIGERIGRAPRTAPEAAA